MRYLLPAAMVLPIVSLCFAPEAAERGRHGPRGGAAAASVESDTCLLSGTIKDKDSGKIVPARIYVIASDGGARFDPAGVIYDRDTEQHFLTKGEFNVQVPAGKTIIRAERGPEFVPAEATIEVASGKTGRVELAPKRWIDMAAEGWYCADLHMHRDPVQIPLALLAEGLNYTPVITTHLHTNNIASTWTADRPAPKDFLVNVDPTHAYTVMDEELERLGARTFGASIFIGLKTPIAVAPALHYPPDLWYIEQARAQGALIDAEKPFWRATPENVALGLIDTMGVVCNHLHRGAMMPEAEPYGAIPRPAKYDRQSGRDFVLWVMEMYYRYLNCGFRLPVTGGTASGIMPSPVGYSRVYAKLDGPFSFENWIAALRAGRTFATNGPMMRFAVNGQDPGADIRLSEDAEIRIEVEARSAAPLEYLEIVQNGNVIARVEGDGKSKNLSLKKRIAVGKSGWIAARCFEKCEITERCAQTSPVYILRDDQPIASRADAEYFIGVIDELIAGARESKEFQTEKERAEVLAIHGKARAVYEAIAAKDQ